jgi:hypothetical protein
MKPVVINLTAGLDREEEGIIYATFFRLGSALTVKSCAACRLPAWLPVHHRPRRASWRAINRAWNWQIP